MKPRGFPETLALYTTARRLTPYAWGTHDCVTFAADWVMELTGVDPIVGIRGSWSDEAGAMAVMQAQGGLVAAMDARFPRRQREFAERGDLVLVPDSQGQMSLAICTGQNAAAPGDEEMLMTSMTEARIVWEV